MNELLCMLYQGGLMGGLRERHTRSPELSLKVVGRRRMRRVCDCDVCAYTVSQQLCRM